MLTWVIGAVAQAESAKKRPPVELVVSATAVALETLDGLPKPSRVSTLMTAEKPPAGSVWGAVANARAPGAPATIVSVWVALVRPMEAAVRAGPPARVSR